MKVITTLKEMRAERKALESPVGFVPTMGFLHAGHSSLVTAARSECTRVVASIFVNPTQFGPKEDLARYPRDLPHDLGMLESAGADLVWTPTAGEMYPAGFQTWVEVERLTRGLESEIRPGHFRGVTTVVAKLFNAVGPDRAYFGQKDAQQAAVIRRMSRDLDFPIEIIVCPTVREPDGLALSSRNTYLNVQERQAATIIFRSLTAAHRAFLGGEHNAETLRRIMGDNLASEPLAKTQYISCADFETLEELVTVHGKALLSLAVLLGKTRLIDNFVIGEGT